MSRTRTPLSDRPSSLTASRIRAVAAEAGSSAWKSRIGSTRTNFRNSRGSAGLPDMMVCHDSDARSPRRTFSTTSLTWSISLPLSPSLPCWAPSWIRRRRPRSVGSPDSASSVSCWATRPSVAAFTSGRGRRSRPLRSKNGPPSGRQADRIAGPGLAASAAASFAAPASASSGVSPSRTATSDLENCGKASSKADLSCAHPAFVWRSWSVSVVIAKRVTVT